MYFFGIQATVAHQFSSQQENRYFVPVARFIARIVIDIDHIDRDAMCRRQRRKLAQHLVAKAAPST
jgi:hypothetical protein